MTTASVKYWWENQDTVHNIDYCRLKWLSWDGWAESSLSLLTRWCLQSWSESGYHQGNGSRTNNLKEARSILHYLNSDLWAQYRVLWGAALVLVSSSEAVPTCVSRQLSGNAYVALTGLQAVYRADIVQASAGHIIPRGGVGACHHPGRAQRDRMHLWAWEKAQI